MAYIEIEDYLYEVSTENLEIELRNRAKNMDNSEHIRLLFKADNARQELAIESLVEKFLKIPLQDFEQFLDKY